MDYLILHIEELEKEENPKPRASRMNETINKYCN